MLLKYPSFKVYFNEDDENLLHKIYEIIWAVMLECLKCLIYDYESVIIYYISVSKYVVHFICNFHCYPMNNGNLKETQIDRKLKKDVIPFQGE